MKEQMSPIPGSPEDIQQKSICYNRYLMVRFITATFLLMNMLWVVVMLSTPWVIVPGMLLLVLIPSVYEQVKLFGQHTNHLPITQTYFWIQLLFNGVVMGLSYTALFEKLYPFVIATNANRNMVIIFLALGLLLAGVALVRLYHIGRNEDKAYRYYQDYEESLNSR